MSLAEDFCVEVLADANPNEDGDACGHWHSRALCGETCICGHGCGEHWGWGGCALCGCIAWEDSPAPPPTRLRPLAAVEKRDPEPERPDELEDEYGDAAGF